MMSTQRNQWVYFTAMALALVVTAAFVLVINSRFDPLWYFDGNRVGQYNEIFDERLTKTNRFLKQPEQYNCIVLGSSRSTLLNQNRLAPQRCFNYSFSAGWVAEHLVYAHYIKQFAPTMVSANEPSLVIMAVEGFNFLPNKPVVVPDFIKALEHPAHWLEAYFSLDALKLSLRTFGGQPFPRRYTREFIGVASKRVAHRPSKQKWSEIDDILGQKTPPTDDGPLYNSDNVVMYQQIREIFSASRFIGYVPPISPDRVVLLSVQNQLDSYLAAIYQAAQVFEHFYDFALPGEINSKPKNTYDGSHYYAEINDLVADRLMERTVEDDFGVDVKALSFAAYRQLYLERIAMVLAQRKSL